MSLELCALVALAKSCFSISATLSPRNAASRAIQAPVIPPPMSRRSNSSLARRDRSRRMELLSDGNGGWGGTDNLSNGQGSISLGQNAIQGEGHATGQSR